MNWKQQLFKPKWQHNDPAVRRDAVASLQDAELLKALPAICLEDQEPAVRSAAARRVLDLEVLTMAQKSEQDAETSEIIGQRILSLTTATATDRPPLTARQKVVKDSDDRQLLERVASRAPEAALRKIALGRISRQGFLGDCAVGDPDASVRQAAARAITQHSTLRRVIKQCRNTDKTLHQALAKRLHRELLDAGDREAVQAEALSLCLVLETWALERQAKTQTIPERIAEKWALIEDKVPADLLARYQRTVSRLQAPVSPAKTRAEEDSLRPEKNAVQAPEPSRDESKPPAAEPVPAPLRAIEQAAQHNEEKLQLAAQHKEEKLQQAESLLSRLQQELEDGALHKALETRHQLTSMGKQLKNYARWKAISKQMAFLHGRLRELREWHHWSNDKIRKQLIAEMEILPDTDLHPDAVLDRVKALQRQWKELEKSEQIPGDAHFHAAPWMWRKFSAAGHKAFKAAKPFLEKRDEIRDRRLQSQQALCDELANVASAQIPDWAALGKLLQAVRKELRALDEIPQRARRKMSTRLRGVLEKGNAAMQSNYAEIEKKKLKLVRAATQLVHVVDMDEAIRAAKKLQADWKSAGSLWRSRENQLWKEFRTPLDPLFARLKEGQENVRAAQRARLESQHTLCKSLKELLAGTDEALLVSLGKVQGLKDSWRDIERPERRLQKQFQELADQVEQRVTHYRQNEVNKIRQRWWDKSSALHKLESALLDGPVEDKFLEQIVSLWPTHDATQEIDVLLDKRFRKVVKSRTVPEADKQTVLRATELCIQLEFLAGLPSPAKEKDQRMKYQVDRLSKSLAGDAEQMAAAAEARIAEQEWLTLPVLRASNRTRFERRIKAALQEINVNNNV